MKNLIIAVSLLTFISCTKKTSTSPSSSSGDSTFNGSYFQLSVNGNSYYVKDVAVGSAHLVVLTATNGTVALNSGSNSPMLTITVQDDFNLYGLTGSSYLFSLGTGTGTYQIPGPSIITAGAGSVFAQYNPLVAYSDTSGTVSISHNGSDYILGTFTTTLWTSGFTYPATGSFKIY